MHLANHKLGLTQINYIERQRLQKINSWNQRLVHMLVIYKWNIVKNTDNYNKMRRRLAVSRTRSIRERYKRHGRTQYTNIS